MKILKKIRISKVLLDNRICIAPMCQYSANNGNPSEWHYNHLGSLMKAGAGLLLIESTAVSKNGRISKKDLTLCNNSNFKNFKKLINYLKKISNTKIGIQLSHAGRKGSSEIPWIRSNKPILKKKGGWNTIAPSSIRRDKYWPYPKEMNIQEIKKIKKNFIASSMLSKKLGLDCLELHMAHGYLLHQFFSPISNLRIDKYGGNIENRCRLLIEIAKEVRKIWPNNKILGARLNGYDWLKNGSTLNDCIYLSRKLKKIGFNYVCITSGGIIPKTNVKFKKGYQVFLAKKVKQNSTIFVKTTGMIEDLKHAEEIVKSKKADLVSFGRKFVNSPNWLIKELISKKKKVEIPNQYKRCF